MLRSLKPAILLAGALMLPSLSVADEAVDVTCAPYASIAQQLLDQYGEQPVATGITDGTGSLMVVTASPNGETWSVLLVDPAERQACFIHSGSDWQLLVQEPSGDPV